MFAALGAAAVAVSLAVAVAASAGLLGRVADGEVSGRAVARAGGRGGGGRDLGRWHELVEDGHDREGGGGGAREASSAIKNAHEGAGKRVDGHGMEGVAGNDLGEGAVGRV